MWIVEFPGLLLLVPLLLATSCSDVGIHLNGDLCSDKIFASQTLSINASWLDQTEFWIQTQSTFSWNAECVVVVVVVVVVVK